MHRLYLALFSVVLLPILASCEKPVDAGTIAASPGFAIVELFTSEGCSSCPPADELLSKIIADSRTKGIAVYPLAFHVDYWNQLGWADRFSSSEFSARQQAYGAALGLPQIYTPQMIVNGSVEFVGSDAAKAAEQINAALQKPANLKIQLTPQLTDHQLSLKYTLSDDSAASTINVAVVERGLQTEVKAGENGGRVLHHDNVVRAFQSADLTDRSGTVQLKIPAAVDLKNASVIAFVQQSKSMKILAAAQVDLGQ